MLITVYLHTAGNRIGNGVSISLWWVFIGVGGLQLYRIELNQSMKWNIELMLNIYLRSGSVHPTSQYVVTTPLPFNSISPLNSIWNVPNWSRICLVASDTWIFKAAKKRTTIQKKNWRITQKVHKTYVWMLIPFVRLYWRYLQTDNNVAFFAQQRLHILALFKRNMDI